MTPSLHFPVFVARLFSSLAPVSPLLRGWQCPTLLPTFPIFLLLPQFSANENIFSSFPLSFLLDGCCPGDSDSWPCLHQVRCISFYFVFHQLWLHKTPLVSGDCCQKLQSPLLVGSFAGFPSAPIRHLPADKHLMKQGSVWYPGRGPDCCQWPLRPSQATTSRGLNSSSENGVGFDSMLIFSF